MSTIRPRVILLILSVVAVPASTSKLQKTEHDDDSAIQRWSSLIGIITAIVGNVLISFALNIQRYAHIRLSRESNRKESWNSNGKQRASRNGNTNQPNPDGVEPDESEEPSPDHISESGSESTTRHTDNEDSRQETYLKSPYWWAGICLMTIGEAGNFLAYGFAPASIVSPLGVVALISNCVIAPFMLKERFRQRDFWGVLVAVAGAITVVSSAQQSETKLGPHEIWDAISRWEFLLYMFITLVLISALVWASSHRYGERTSLVDLGLVGLFGMSDTSNSTLLTGLGGYTALSTKGIASLLSYTFWRVLTFPITYLLVAILVSSAMLQIRYINKALQRFDSTQVIPIQFVLFTISVIVGSAVLYRDFESATVDQVLKFVAGCALTFAGVYLITSGREQGGESHVNDEEDEEESIGLEQEGGYGADHARPSGHSDETSNLIKDKRRNSHYGTSSTPQTPQQKLSNQSSSFPSFGSYRDTVSAEGSQLETPWPSDEQNVLHPRHALLPTTSSPILPSEAQGTDVRPSAGRAVTHHLPVTPSHQSLGRRSMSRMLPGPLFSPLSSSLSAVVADSLRRGVDTLPSPREVGSLQDVVRRPRLKSKSLRASESSVPNEDDSSTTPFKSRQSSEGGDRRKSFTASIGNLFRKKPTGDSDNPDEAET
jgi:drug/metabolite transporter (DMT)-like permease